MYGTGFDLFFLGGVLFSAVPIGLVVLGILVFASNRDVDASGRRSYAVYLCTVCFISLFAALFAAFAISSALLGLMRSDDDDGAIAPRVATGVEVQAFEEGSGEGDSYPPDHMGPDGMGPGSDFDEMPFDDSYDDPGEADEGDEAARGVVGGGIALLVAGGAFVYHLRRLRDLQTEAGYAQSPAGRVEHAYAYATAFTATLVGLGAAGAALWGAFNLAAPGVAAEFGEGERIDGLVDLLQAALLAAGSFVILVRHLSRGRELREAMHPGTTNGGAPPTQIQI